MKERPFREALYSGGRTDAALLNNLLQVEGIDTVVAADRRVARIGAQSGASIYVLDPAQVARAHAIAERYRRHQPLKDPKSYRSWRCRACNELVEGQFEVCWKCNASGPPARDEPAALEIETGSDTIPSPTRPIRDVMVMLVFLLAALLLMFASSARRRAGQLPALPLPVTGQR